MSFSIESTSLCCTKFLKDVLSDTNLKSKYLTQDTAFVRNRALPLSVMAQLILLSMKSTYAAEVPIELSRIAFGEGSLPEKISKSAYSQRRKLIKPEFMTAWSASIVHEALKQGLQLKQWRGMIPVAMDGTTAALPATKANAEYFGKWQNQKGELGPIVKILLLTTLLDPFILDSDFGDVRRSEHDAAQGILHNLTEKHLLILDRGYPSFTLMRYLGLHKINFIIRLPMSFSRAVKDFVASERTDDILEIKANKHSLPRLKKLGIQAVIGEAVKIRVVKFTTPNGCVEILATSLPKDEFTIADIGDAYLLRWKVEVNIFFLKEEQQLETFSGYSPRSILQDLGAAIALFNICSIFKYLSDIELDNKNKGREKVGMRPLAVDRNVAFCYVRCYLPFIMGNHKDRLSYEKGIVMMMVSTAITEEPSPPRKRKWILKRNRGRYWTDLNFKVTMLI